MGGRVRNLGKKCEDIRVGEIAISDLGKIVTGKTPSTKNPEFFHGNYQFVTPSDLDWKTYYCQSTERTINEEAKNPYRNQFIPPDSVMVTCIGNTIGKCGISSGECLTNQQINTIIPKTGINPKFVYYLMIHNKEMIRGVGIGGGSATPILNKTAFSKIRLRVPSENSWGYIASILSVYDDLIENNRRRIHLLERAARLLYKEWFIHLRFPGHEHVPITDGIPKGWERKALGDFAEIKGGKQYGDNELDGYGEVPVFGGNGVQGYSLKCTHSGFLIVFGRVGANCGSVYWSYDGAWVNNNASSVVPDSHNELILQHLLHYDFGHLRKGSAQPFIPNSILSTVQFLIPTEALAIKFCETIRKFRYQQRNLDHQIRLLAQARDLLLPRLMNGKVSI